MEEFALAGKSDAEKGTETTLLKLMESIHFGM